MDLVEIRLTRPASGEFGAVSGVVGGGWARYLRFPHPAWTSPGEGTAIPVPWSSVARRVGTSFSPDATWFEISRRRPHTDYRDDFLMSEPEAGHESSGLVEDLVTALGSAYQSGRIWMGSWDGAGCIPSKAIPFRLHRREYSGWLTTITDWDVRCPPHLLCDDEGYWFVAVDPDGMSHYVATSDHRPVMWPEGRERVPVVPTMPAC